jgi:uncharacterized repeat protein (TIGR04138 family)
VVEVARELRRYTLDAFEFLHRGLDYTVQREHGPPDPILSKLSDWMEKQGLDLTELQALLDREDVPPVIAAAIEHFGGPIGLTQKLNRHVGGAALCYGLRDFAVSQWGYMAPAVLRSWGIRSTSDFGRMVFALVEAGLLQKLPDDRIQDFDKVYDFDTAFADAYKISITDPAAS